MTDQSENQNIQNIASPSHQDFSSESCMLVRDLMNTDITTIAPNVKLAEAVTLMSQRDISCLIVEDDDSVIGIIANEDLRKIVTDHSDKDASELLVSDIMSSPVKSVPPDLSVLLAGRIVDSQNFSRLPVIDNNKLVGLITQKNILMAVKNSLLAEEENNFRLMESSQSCIFTTNIDGTVTYINQALMDLLGLESKSEVIGQQFLPENFWADKEQKDAFYKELKNGSVDTVEVILKNTKGDKLYCTLFFTFTNNDSGQIAGCQGIIYDVTAQKELVELRETQQQLKQSQQRYRNLIETTSDWIWEMDQRYAYTYSSPAIDELLGLTSDQVIGQTPFDLLASDQDQDSIENLQNTLTTHEPFKKLEKNFLHKNGSVIVLQTSSVPILNPAGKFMGYRGISRDVTTRKRAEQTLNDAHLELIKINKELESKAKKPAKPKRKSASKKD